MFSVLALGLSAGVPAFADHNSNGSKSGGPNSGGLRAVPFVFVGTARQCSPGPAGSNIVTSAWLAGLGLPDNGRPNTQFSGNPARPVGGTLIARDDPHRGLLLNKNGPTPDCSSAGATIEGFPRGTRLRTLGFDYRNGTHCGAGAPRFNITTVTGVRFFAGCANGTQSPAPQDPEQWTRVRFTAAQIDPATTGTFVFGQTEVRSITIIYDEGTDTAGLNDPAGVGLAVIDNIAINNRLITRGSGIKPNGKQGKDDDDDDDHDDDDHDDDDDDDHDDDDHDDDDDDHHY